VAIISIMTKITDDLDSQTDQTLNELFALEVAGWWYDAGNEATMTAPRWRSPDGTWTAYLNFCSDANAVLPHLEKWKSCDIWYHRLTGLWTIEFEGAAVGASAASLPRAAVIGMLRVNRATAKEGEK